MDGIPIIKKDAEFPGQYTDVLMQVLSCFCWPIWLATAFVPRFVESQAHGFFEMQYIDMDPFCMRKFP